MDPEISPLHRASFRQTWAVTARPLSVDNYTVEGLYYPTQHIGHYDNPRTGNPYWPTSMINGIHFQNHLVGGLFFFHSPIYWEKSSQLTNIFRGVAQQPTSHEIPYLCRWTNVETLVISRHVESKLCRSNCSNWFDNHDQLPVVGEISMLVSFHEHPIQSNIIVDA